MAGDTDTKAAERSVRLEAEGANLQGDLCVPEGARAVVLFAHGTGSSRHSPRNRFVAQALHAAGVATLVIDLLTAEEEAVDVHTAHLRFDISLLADRLVAATDWLAAQPDTEELGIGYFGASTGAGAALVAAAARAQVIGAVVSRGGRPDLAGPALAHVWAPTLLIVGGEDTPVLGINRRALAQLPNTENQLVIVPGASHLFEEPGALAEVARLAAAWFTRRLSPVGNARFH
jgi:putative phosphoribosyl transferase